jgi:hypothetical protein
MVNNEAAAVLVEYSQHIARYAAIADVPEETETVLTKAARNHAWRLLSKLIELSEAAKESDLFWQLLDRDNTPKESYRLRCIAKHEDMKFMKAKRELGELLKEVRAIERKDPTGKKRQAELDAVAKRQAESEARREAEKKERARQRREERKAEKLEAAEAAAIAATSKAKAASKKTARAAA